jgi:hypothetical protein
MDAPLLHAPGDALSSRLAPPPPPARLPPTCCGKLLVVGGLSRQLFRTVATVVVAVTWSQMWSKVSEALEDAQIGPWPIVIVTCLYVSALGLGTSILLYAVRRHRMAALLAAPLAELQGFAIKDIPRSLFVPAACTILGGVGKRATCVCVCVCLQWCTTCTARVVSVVGGAYVWVGGKGVSCMNCCTTVVCPCVG